jgi:ubiquinone biosynthesis protein UbiJ
MLDPLASSSLNHLLRSNSWAPERLKPYAGKTARFECAPFSFMLSVLENGEVAAAAAAVTPDTTIRLTPGLMLRVLVRDETVWNEIEIDGDTEFAAVINRTFRNLRWNIEEDLSRVFGDIAAHRMVQTGRTLDEWRAQSFDNLARSFAEYWTEEQPLIARARQVAQFNRDVDQLRDDVARFEKRLEQIQNRQVAKDAKKT